MSCNNNYLNTVVAVGEILKEHDGGEATLKLRGSGSFSIDVDLRVGSCTDVEVTGSNDGFVERVRACLTRCTCCCCRK